jgi:signal peptidase I
VVRAWRGPARAAAAALLLALAVRGSVVEPFAVPTGSMAPTLLAGDVVLVWRAAYAVRLPFTAVTLLARPGPRRGDVVAFREPGGGGRLLVRRVVGVAGDEVALRDQVLVVNGVAQPRLEAGELAYLEPAGEGAAPRRDTCRRLVESLARGPLAPPAGAGEAAAAAAFARGAGAGVARHQVLQCRRVRPGREEGPFGPVAAGSVLVMGDNRDRSGDGREGAGWQVPLADVVGRVALVTWRRDPSGRPGDEAGTPWIERLFKPVE